MPDCGAHRPVALPHALGHRPDRLFRIGSPFAWAYTITAFTGGTAQQPVHGHPGRLAQDVPQRGVHRGNGGHGHGAAAPVCALVEQLPHVFDSARVPADEHRHDVLREIAGNRELPPVERCVTETVDAVFGGQLERHEIAARAADDDPCVGDFHPWSPAWILSGPACQGEQVPGTREPGRSQ